MLNKSARKECQGASIRSFKRIPARLSQHTSDLESKDKNNPFSMNLPVCVKPKWIMSRLSIIAEIEPNALWGKVSWRIHFGKTKVPGLTFYVADVNGCYMWVPETNVKERSEKRRINSERTSFCPSLSTRTFLHQTCWSCFDRQANNTQLRFAFATVVM